MSEDKKLCTVHHLYYKGDRCPMCEKERIENMAQKYRIVDQNDNKKSNKSRDINEHDIQRLIEKFNVR